MTVSRCKIKLLREGSDITILSMSYMTIEALHAVDHLVEQGINCDLIDLRCVRPLDWEAIEASVSHTGRLLVPDTGNLTGLISGEIVARITTNCWEKFGAPQRLAMPDFPEATSPALTENYHIRAEHIAKKLEKCFLKMFQFLLSHNSAITLMTSRVTGSQGLFKLSLTKPPKIIVLAASSDIGGYLWSIICVKVLKSLNLPRLDTKK